MSNSKTLTDIDIVMYSIYTANFSATHNPFTAAHEDSGANVNKAISDKNTARSNKTLHNKVH